MQCVQCVQCVCEYMQACCVCCRGSGGTGVPVFCVCYAPSVLCAQALNSGECAVCTAHGGECGAVQWDGVWRLSAPCDSLVMVAWVLSPGALPRGWAAGRLAAGRLDKCTAQEQMQFLGRVYGGR